MPSSQNYLSSPASFSSPSLISCLLLVSFPHLLPPSRLLLSSPASFSSLSLLSCCLRREGVVSSTPFRSRSHAVYTTVCVRVLIGVCLLSLGCFHSEMFSKQQEVHLAVGTCSQHTHPHTLCRQNRFIWRAQLSTERDHSRVL